MKLFYSPFHTFIHKSLVAAHEAGVHEQVTYVPTYPFFNNDGEDVSGQYSLAPINPLDKVPTLALALRPAARVAPPPTPLRRVGRRTLSLPRAAPRRHRYEHHFYGACPHHD